MNNEANRKKWSKKFSQSYDLLISESDRGAAIVGAALIEVALDDALKKYLIPSIDKRDEILNSREFSFALKIDLAYRVGLIKKNIRNGLHQIRRIRNEFAHSPEFLTFTENSVSDRIKNSLDTVEDFFDIIIDELNNKVKFRAEITKNNLIKILGERISFITLVSINISGLAYLYDDIEPIQPVA
jgi:uncharacterized protein YlaN (UPF0358 family)